MAREYRARDDDDRGSRRGRDDDDRGSRRRDEDDPPARRGRGDDRDDDRGSRRGRDTEDSGRGGSAAGRFKYVARTAESVKKRSDMSSGDFDSYVKDGVKLFKPADGDNTIRILPPTWDGSDHFGYDVWVHYGVGADQQSYLCLHKMKGEPCPICEEMQRAQRAREDEDYVSSLKPTRRVMYYIIDRENEKEGLQVWAAPQTVDQAIVKVSVDRRSGEVLLLDHPEEGYDIEFEKTGKGISTRYVGVAIARRESRLGNNKWLDEAVAQPLPEVLHFFDYDHVNRIFGGGGAGVRRDRDDGGRDDRGSSRGHDRDTDRDNTRRESRRREPDHTWESVHALEGSALDKLVEDERLDIDVKAAKSDEELADQICELLKLDPPRRSRDEEGGGRRRRVIDDEDDDDRARDKLRGMGGGR